METAADDPVRFADVEAALPDARRFRWIAPVICGAPDDPAGSRRAMALYAAHRQGLRGVPLVDAAMEACPE
jgi:hypothetical protein